MNFIKTNNQITVYVEGTLSCISSEHPNFAKVEDMLMRTKNVEWDEYKVNVLKNYIESDSVKLIEYFDSYGVPIQIEDGLIKYKDYVIKSLLADRILQMKSMGIDPSPLLRFVERVTQNPSSQSINELYDFLTANNIPIRNDGKFLVYKKVRSDYTDIHSGRFDNTPGKVVSLTSRTDVDPNRNNLCSHGLHVCAYEYLNHFGSDDRIKCKVIVVAVDPADVVSVPADYNNAKMRVWKYEVLEDIGDWKSIKLRDFVVEEDDIYEEWNEYEDREKEYLDDPEKGSIFDPANNEVENGNGSIFDKYDLTENDGVEFLENHVMMDQVLYTHAGKVYGGYNLINIPPNSSIKQVIDLGKKVENQDTAEFLNNFKYENKIKRDRLPKERTLIAVSRIDGFYLNKPKLVAPSTDKVEYI